MPRFIINFSRHLSLMPQTTQPLDPDTKNVQTLIRYAAIYILLAVFTAALVIAMYYYFWLGKTDLPGLIFIVLGSGVAFAFNALGFQSGANAIFQAVQKYPMPTIIQQSPANQDISLEQTRYDLPKAPPSK